MVNIGERVRQWQQMRDETPELEQLGFCPDDKTAMMFYWIEYNNNDRDYGRVCPKCGYDSPYHRDGGGTFIEEVDEIKETLIMIGHWSMMPE